MARRTDLPGGHVPPESSPRWRQVTLPLRAWLAGGWYTIAEIEAWGRAHGWTPSWLTNGLAWLDLHHLVRSTGRGAETRWRGVAVEAEAAE